MSGQAKCGMVTTSSKDGDLTKMDNAEGLEAMGLSEMRQESGFGDEDLSHTLRYHHLLCLPRFIGEGYSNDFTRNMAEVKKRLESEGLLANGQWNLDALTLVEGPDQVCAACPNLVLESGSHVVACSNLAEGKCSSQEKVMAYDRVVKECMEARRAEDTRGSKVAPQGSGALLRSKESSIVPTPQEVCTDCSWYEICRNLEV